MDDEPGDEPEEAAMHADNVATGPAAAEEGPGALGLPQRQGPRPETTRPTPGTGVPHTQTSQNAPVELQEELFRRAAGLPGVTTGGSLVSVPGARAFHLDAGRVRGPGQAFQAGREFAHLHPAHDGSLHLALPPAVEREALAAGWVEPHPVAAGAVLVYGPRDRAELEVVWRLVVASYRYATGEAPAPEG